MTVKKMASDKFLNELAEYLTEKVGQDWYLNFEHDSGALFVKLTIPEEVLDWGDDDC